MTENLFYALSGKTGIQLDRTKFLISQLKKAGVVFPHYPKFGIVNGQLIFNPIQTISDEIRESAIALIKGEGVRDAKIEVAGKCPCI